MSHALVIGGTGMLRPVTEHLARTYKAVSVVARSKRDLEELEREFPGVVHGLPLDYRDTVTLRAVVDAAVLAYGRIDPAVVWVHMEKAPEAPFAVAEFVGSAEVPGRFLHVLGSAAADPSQPAHTLRMAFTAFPQVAYRDVVLGFVRGKGGSRWLTNAEIAAGVLGALEGDSERTIVGVVEPWAERP